MIQHGVITDLIKTGQLSYRLIDLVQPRIVRAFVAMSETDSGGIHFPYNVGHFEPHTCRRTMVFLEASDRVVCSYVLELSCNFTNTYRIAVLALAYT